MGLISEIGARQIELTAYCRGNSINCQIMAYLVRKLPGVNSLWRFLTESYQYSNSTSRQLVMFKTITSGRAWDCLFRNQETGCWIFIFPAPLGGRGEHTTSFCQKRRKRLPKTRRGTFRLSAIGYPNLGDNEGQERTWLDNLRQIACGEIK